MYVLRLHYDNTRWNDTGTRDVRYSRVKIRKWTLLPGGEKGRELLRLIALACAGHRFLHDLSCDPHWMRRNPLHPLRLEVLLATHPPMDREKTGASVLGSGIEIGDDKTIRALSKAECRQLPLHCAVRTPAIGTGNTAFFFLGYGPELTPHCETDLFDFSNPLFRVTRFQSLLNTKARVTDPVAFLEKLKYRGVLRRRFPALETLRCFRLLFEKHLGVETWRWMEPSCDFRGEWERLRPAQKRVLVPILDATRHLIDAFPRSGTPLRMPGVVLLDRPDLYCPPRIFPQWIALLDRVFPNIQFLVTLSPRVRSAFPVFMNRRLLRLPPPAVRAEKKARARLRPGTILLLDVDSRLPNLALMKLSRYYREQGRRVFLARKDSFIRGADLAYASCVFSSPASARRIGKLKDYYGESLVLGGSGVDVRARLPPEIEDLPPDYTVYPELGDRAIGFLTRGCPFRCPFCIVPIKEGKPRQVSDLDSLIQKRRRKLILLDDNILSHPRAGDLLEEMVRRDLQVNFTQTLDLRFVDEEKARILRRIRSANTRFTRRVYHFSLNDARNLDAVSLAYGMFGFTAGDNVEFVCMYAYTTSLAEDVERFRFLRSLPGAYVFVQEYRPIPGGPPARLSGFWRGDADALIDELITIIFPQNMKSMEKYYRWLSEFYFRTYGRPHRRLVDTIFRYNQRDRKGIYIASLRERKKERIL